MITVFFLNSIVMTMDFPVVMYGCELDYKESWAPKNWCFWTAVLEKIRDSLGLQGDQYWVCKEIQPVQSVIGRTDVEAETPILSPPDAKRWLIGKYPDAGKIEGKRRMGLNRGWDGWMASLTQWTWVWANSGRYWRIGEPGMLQFMRLESDMS